MAMMRTTRSVGTACLLAATATLVFASSPSLSAPETFAFSRAPKLLTVQPAGNGYNVVFRLNRPLPRRTDGSVDAGIRTAAGYESEFTTADRRDNCYFAAAAGRSRHTGLRVSVRLLLGDGHDPIGHVHSVQTLAAKLTAARGTAGRHGSFKAETAAARKLGCAHLDRHLG
jgi:hypothetical protein